MAGLWSLFNHRKKYNIYIHDFEMRAQAGRDKFLCFKPSISIPKASSTNCKALMTLKRKK